MAQITLKGNPINTSGDLPAAGTKAPEFTLVAGDLSDCTLADFAGKTVIVNIVPSFDTGVCATSIREFNKRADEADCVVLNVSKDLPFAQKRFCDTEDLNNVTNVSAFRCNGFGDGYGMTMLDGPLKGLLARGIVVVNGSGDVVYNELVPEIAQEPNYDAALNAISQTA
ncbi:thiol peroxidase [bacterium]|nr:thiol peroxidase [bacterium]